MKKYRITASYMDKYNKTYTEVLEKEIGDQENIADYIPPKMPLIVEMWNNKNHLNGIEYVHSKAYYEENAREKAKSTKKTPEQELNALLSEVSNIYLTIATRLLK